MPKGLIPLIGGLGVAGTMVGISIPSAVTVIPKKNETNNIKQETHSYNGFVFNNKIYSTELKAKEALLTELKSVNNGIKTPSQNGSVEYSINNLDGPVTGLSDSFAFGATAPTVASLKNKYTFATPGASVAMQAESTIVSIRAPKLVYPSFTEFNDFKYSLSAIDTNPKETIDNIDLGSYIGNSVNQVHLSGEQIFSAADNKFYWYADAPSAGLYGADSAHHNVMWTNESLAATNTWGEAPAPGTANAAKLAVKFDNAATSKAAGAPIFIYTSLTEAQIKTETVSYNGVNYKYHASGVYLRYMNIMLSASTTTPGDRPGHNTGTGTKFALQDSTNHIVGHKTVWGTTAPTLQDINIQITKTINPMAAVMWDMNELNSSPTELSKITKKVSSTPLTYEDITNGASTTHSPYLYSEEVLND